jgi:hypothetical protein
MSQTQEVGKPFAERLPALFDPTFPHVGLTFDEHSTEILIFFFSPIHFIR